MSIDPLMLYHGKLGVTQDQAKEKRGKNVSWFFLRGARTPDQELRVFSRVEAPLRRPSPPGAHAR